MFYREAGVFKTSYAADMALMPMPNTRWAVAALAVLFIGIAPVVCDEYTLSVLNLILIAVVGAIGLNILVGYTDQVSIGHGAFMSVGAYSAAHLITQLHAPFWIAVPAGGLMAAAIGTLVGIPSLRIKGLYLAIATLAAQLIIEWTINHVPWVSGGTQSTIQVGPPSVFGTKLTSAWQMYLFLMFFVILAMVGTQNLIRSRIGRAFIAIRDQDIAAEIIGINIFRYKLWAFAISSFYAGVTGVLYTYYLGIANYEQFQLDVSINFLAMVIIGGLGSTLGPVFGAIFVTLLPIVTRRVLEVGRRPVLQRVRSFGGHSEPAARDLRRADHLLSGRRAGGPEPAVAQHPELLPDVAILVLRQQQGRPKMRHLTRSSLTLAGCVTAGLWLAGGAAAQQKEILIGSQCDRTGPTQLVGTIFCPAVQDYVNLVNAQGGVDGYKVVINELDNNYQVPSAIEEYERHRQQGMVSTLIWGTPQAEALNPRLEKDHIPGTSPGFGSAAAANGAKYRLSVPAGRDLLVAGRRGDSVRQGQAWRQPKGQEDRLSLLRQPGGYSARCRS